MSFELDTAESTQEDQNQQHYAAGQVPGNSRRRFLAQAGMAGIAGIGLLGAGQIGAFAQNQNQIDAIARAEALAQGKNKNKKDEIRDFDILNFALELEYLEAEFYLRAAFGRALNNSDVTGTGTLGPVSGGRAVPFATPAIRQYAEEIANDEEAHVKTLRSVLGRNAVARPKIDLQTSFTAAARAAGVVGQNQTFDPFANENSFLLGAFIFEDVGVTAYKGAARFIDNRDLLDAAAGLLAVEAYHAAIIRTTLFARGLSDPAQKISDLRDAADGPGDADQGIVLNGKANLVPTDANGLVFSRTTAQVLKIVYLGMTPVGGFFPDGLNGRIR